MPTFLARRADWMVTLMHITEKQDTGGGGIAELDLLVGHLNGDAQQAEGSWTRAQEREWS